MFSFLRLVLPFLPLISKGHALSSAESDSIALINFYTSDGLDSLERSFTSLLSFDENQLENEHNFIQTMFPLHEPSNMISNAPILTREIAALLSTNKIARERFLKALLIFRNFLGITGTSSIISTRKTSIDNVIRQKRIVLWLYNGNHNILRVTRIIRSLRLVGLEREALDFYRDVSHEGHAAGLESKTLAYWRRAAIGEIFDTMQGDTNDEF